MKVSERVAGFEKLGLRGRRPFKFELVLWWREVVEGG